MLVVDGSTSRLATRIREELATMGFDPVLEAREASSVDELPVIARTGEAAVAARLEVVENGLRVWVFDRATGKTLSRELWPATERGEASLALHIVELLRASLLELKLPNAPRGDQEPTQALLEVSGVPPGASGIPPAAPASAPVASAAPVPAPAATDAAAASLPEAPTQVPLVALELGAAVVQASGDLDYYPALLAAVQIFVSSDFRLGPVGWVPLRGMDHVAAIGSSDNRMTLFGGEARWQPGHSTWRPFVCLGLGAAYLKTRGAAASAEFEGETNHAITPGAFLRTGLGVRLSRRLRLNPQLNLGVQSRYFSIDYADGSAAHWGPWWGVVSLTLEGDFVE